MTITGEVTNVAASIAFLTGLTPSTVVLVMHVGKPGRFSVPPDTARDKVCLIDWVKSLFATRSNFFAGES